MSDHQHCINCLETAEGFYSYPCQQCGWSPDQYNESGLYLSPGTILNGQYQIARMLGHGGFGITYLAWDNLLHRRLAIKEYMPRDFATRNATNSTISVFAGEAGENFAYGLERFLDEARTLAKFQQHAGIVSVLNVFYSNSTGYMVMEYVEGRTLKDYLMEKGNLSWELTLQLFMPIMDALREVHKSGILHRDISPDNIYLCNDNRVKLLDFGAARYALGGHSQSLSVVVKPGYAPEEQYRAKGKQGTWTDVYSVAASMYRCIAGVVPPDALDRLDEDELISPSDLGIPMPEKSEAALMSALAIKANDRTQNIEAFQQPIWKQINNNELRVVETKPKKIVPPASTQNEPITVDLTDEVVKSLKEGKVAKKTMTFYELYFSNNGRISRSTYLIHGVIFPTLLFFLLLTARFDGLSFLLILMLFSWAATMSIKRYHDRNKSGYYAFIVLIPVIGLIETCFIKGTNGANRYGQDPLK